jgi:hypothetical protein
VVARYEENNERTIVFRISGIFKVGQFPMWGLMASEVTRLFYCFKQGGGSTNPNTAGSAGDVYIDLAAAMTAVNRKQYHQVKRNGQPLCYSVTVTAQTSRFGTLFQTAPNSWTTRNAVKKTAIGWKRQLKHGGVKMSDLPTYAKRFRCAFDENGHTGGAGTQTLYAHLEPILADQHTSAFTLYVDSLGNNANYDNTNEIVMVPVGPDGAVVDYRMNLLGVSSSGEFGIISEFLKSRRNIRDASDPTLEFPDPDNLLDPLFATAEELSDDIVDAVDDYSTQRPYDETAANDPVCGVRIEPTTTGIPVVMSMEVPLGLIKLGGVIAPAWESGEATYGEASHEGDVFFIDIHAIYEM